jgi:hypothetical protein
MGRKWVFSTVNKRYSEKYGYPISDSARNYIWAEQQDGTTLEKEVWDWVKSFHTMAKGQIPHWNDDSPTFSEFTRPPEKVRVALSSLRTRSDDLDNIIWNEGRKKKNKWAGKARNRS